MLEGDMQHSGNKKVEYWTLYVIIVIRQVLCSTGPIVTLTEETNYSLVRYDTYQLGLTICLIL